MILEIKRESETDARLLSEEGEVAAVLRRLDGVPCWAIRAPDGAVEIGDRYFDALEGARDWVAAELAQNPRALKIREAIAQAKAAVGELGEAAFDVLDELDARKAVASWPDFLRRLGTTRDRLSEIEQATAHREEPPHA